MGVESFFYPKFTTLPPAWKSSSFTTLGALWIMSNNSLTPTDWKIRNVKDLGTIKNSFEKQEINFFDRQIATKLNFTERLIRIAKGPMRSVALLGVFVFAAPVGVFWHAGNCAVIWIKGGDQATLTKHINSLFYDLVWCSSNFVFMLITKTNIFKYEFKTNLGDLFVFVCSMELVLKPFFIIWAWFSPESLNMYTGSSISIILKREFGLVGENGWLLTFNKAVDDITVESSKTEDGVVVSGYFHNLWEEHANEALLEFRQIINTLQLELQEEELKEFSKSPVRLFRYLHNYIALKNGELLHDKTQLESSMTKLDQLFENYYLIGSVLRNLLNSHNIKGAPFPFSPEVCRSFFTLHHETNQTSQQLLEDYNNQLDDIKKINLLEGGPNNDFIAIKRKILNAKNAYDILDLNSNASESIYKKAYFKSAKQLHPDKLPVEWQEQGTKLFHVIDTAYKYANSVYIKKT